MLHVFRFKPKNGDHVHQSTHHVQVSWQCLAHTSELPNWWSACPIHIHLVKTKTPHKEVGTKQNVSNQAFRRDGMTSRYGRYRYTWSNCNCISLHVLYCWLWNYAILSNNQLMLIYTYDLWFVIIICKMKFQPFAHSNLPWIICKTVICQGSHCLFGQWCGCPQFIHLPSKLL